MLTILCIILVFTALHTQVGTSLGRLYLSRVTFTLLLLFYLLRHTQSLLNDRVQTIEEHVFYRKKIEKYGALPRYFST